ncbi:MAG TPA: 4a-hydroxytetrahydrobiopterin dehydratase [Candidatus Corynebacterium avicola]|uniref:Putative pterin-4-alpha-carbinolamine dehydratase n=1 Tax=Candidatus Corynebacterium avicola TaxID=2838527 RepID=A0A9D1RMU1_9CORY|nr:4a-hydroxytetrahydrobiopterin dehydratase [Candidatus Corynebacterium avicola]
MSKNILSETEIQSELQTASLDGWKVVEGLLTVTYDTKDFATGLRLVNLIGAAAEDADHHPDIVLTYPQVEVSLISHDVGGLTSRDVDMAKRTSELAEQEGVKAVRTD